MKTTRTRSIVPDQDLDDAKLAELELDDRMDGGVASTSSAGSNRKSVVTGSTPQVCSPPLRVLPSLLLAGAVHIPLSVPHVAPTSSLLNLPQAQLSG
jgi:hypothetical protein